MKTLLIWINILAGSFGSSATGRQVNELFSVQSIIGERTVTYKVIGSPDSASIAYNDNQSPEVVIPLNSSEFTLLKTKILDVVSDKTAAQNCPRDLVMFHVDGHSNTECVKSLTPKANALLALLRIKRLTK